MKNLILASAVALASFVGISTQSEAATIVHVDNHHHHCIVKTVRHHVNGHWVVRKERVCR